MKSGRRSYVDDGDEPVGPRKREAKTLEEIQGEPSEKPAEHSDAIASTEKKNTKVKSSSSRSKKKHPKIPSKPKGPKNSEGPEEMKKKVMENKKLQGRMKLERRTGKKLPRLIRTTTKILIRRIFSLTTFKAKEAYEIIEGEAANKGGRRI
jgi:hypothetical protein